MTFSSEVRTRDGVATAGLAVLEGMPGAGKTTALGMLADQGYAVLGEYTDAHAGALDLTAYPHHDDEAPHLVNWLRKDAQAHALAQAGGVVADRDWLTALGWAASVGGLADRAAWVHRRLVAGGLTLPSRWVVLDCSPRVSLSRRAGRLDVAHPWAHPDPLTRLRAFYACPVGTVGKVHPPLADLLAAVPVVRVDAEASRDAVGHAIRQSLT